MYSLLDANQSEDWTSLTLRLSISTVRMNALKRYEREVEHLFSVVFTERELIDEVIFGSNQ